MAGSKASDAALKISNIFSAATRARPSNRRRRPDSIATLHCTFNNVLVTVSDASGKVLTLSTGGAMGFTGRARASGPAAQAAAFAAGSRATELGHKLCTVHVKGPMRSRQSAVRGLNASGLRVASIRDVTPLPHNGCRPRKARRLYSTTSMAAVEAASARAPAIGAPCVGAWGPSPLLTTAATRHLTALVAPPHAAGCSSPALALASRLAAAAPVVVAPSAAVEGVAGASVANGDAGSRA